jgi:glycine/D-amino acid oxidase-like deaminating enzyme
MDRSRGSEPLSLAPAEPTIPDEAEPLARSLWTATAREQPSFPSLSDSIGAEVAVVGGGYTGMSAALHLAEAGREVVVLEAKSVGWGASGRNGGQVIPGLKADPDAIEEKYGNGRGARIVAFVGAAADDVFRLVARHEIACSDSQTGWMQLCHNPAAFEAAEARFRQWAARGAPVRLLDAAEAAVLTGTDAYVGAYVDLRAGKLHPLDFAHGLAVAAARSGARIFTRSRVRSLTHDGGGYSLAAGEGSVRAQAVLLCTNGYSAGPVPTVATTVVPVSSVQVATAPLPPSLRHGLLPEGHVASDTRRLITYFRTDAEGRFIIGGRGAYSQSGTLEQQDSLRCAARRLFPQLAGVDWPYAWGGNVAMTIDHFPQLYQVESGLMAGLGYNGRGVAMSVALGKVLAEWASGKSVHSLDYPVTSMRRIPFYGWRRPIVGLLTRYYRFRDSI